MSHITHQSFRDLDVAPEAVVAPTGNVLVLVDDGDDALMISMTRPQAEELLASLETALEQLEHENGAQPSAVEA